jgi:predicted acylesterase/phospholipase RssA
VVFAGGGNRCVWQVGFWEVVAPAVGLKPRVVAAVSAGAFMAAMLFSGRMERAMANALAAFTANRKNFHPAELLRGRRPFPHPGIFRGMLEILDEEALAALRQGPELRVLLARPPRWSGAVGGVLLGFGAYTLEKMLYAPVHPRLPARLGFVPEVVRAGDCANPGELAELIMATSCTPPVVPTMYRHGGPVLDGGLVDNVPLLAIKPGEGPTLVLLTRRYRPALLQGHPGVTYLQPSRPIATAKWDYTDAQGVRAAHELGRIDGEAFLRHGPSALQV